MNGFRLFCVLLAVFSGTVTGVPLIKSQVDGLRIVNGNSYRIHQNTVVFGQDDLRVPYTYTFVDPVTLQPTGNTATPVIEDVYALYGKKLQGWIPLATFMAQAKVCLAPFGVSADQLNSAIADPTAFGSQSMERRGGGWALESNTRLKHPVVSSSSAHQQQRQQRNRVRTQSIDLDPSYRQSAIEAGTTAIGLGAFAVGGPFAGIVAGAIAPFLLSEVFGGNNNGLDKFIKSVKEGFDAVGADLTNVHNWLGDVNNVLQTTGVRLDNLDAQLQLTNAGFQVVTQDIQLLTLNQQKQALLVQELARNMTANFALVQNEFYAAGVSDQVLRNATVALLTRTQLELAELVRRETNLADTVTGLVVNSYRQYTDQLFTRALTQTIYQQRSNGSLFPIPTRMFVRDEGTRPMTLEERANYSTLANAVSTANAHMLYTLNSSGTLIATDFNVTFRVDPEFLVNNTVPGMESQTMFSHLGPADNRTGARCFPYGTNNSATTWSCHAIFEIQRTTCVLVDQSGRDVFPFTWNSTGNASMALGTSPEVATRCAGGTVTRQTIDPSNLNPATVSFITDITMWNTVLTNLCGSVGSMVPSAAGYKARFTSDFMTYISDRKLPTSVNGTSLDDVCNPSFGSIKVLNYPVERISFQIYDMLARSYQILIGYILRYAEARLFGTPPTDLDWEWSQHERGVNSTITYQCKTARWVEISDEKVPVYSVALVDPQVHEISLSINGGSSVLINGVYTTPAGNGYNSNFTWESAASVDIPFQKLLPDTGDVLLGDIINDKWIIDAPTKNMVLVGDSGSRGYTPLYIFQAASYGADTPITRGQWMKDNNFAKFDPEKAQNSAIYYLREKYTDPISGRVTCRNRIPLNLNVSAAYNDSTANNVVCASMQFFDIEDTLDGYQRYHANEFSVEATFEMPTGLDTLTLVSKCPMNYTVSPTVDQSVVTFYTTSVDAITVNIRVTSVNSTCDFQRPGVSYSASRPYSLIVPACGQQFVNVFLLDSIQPCYDGGGIPVRVEQSASDSPLVPPQINTRIMFVADEVRIAMAKQIDASVSLQLAFLSALTAADVDEYRRITDEAYRNFTIIVANTTAAMGNSTAYVNEVTADLLNRTAQIQDSTTTLFEIMRNMTQLQQNETYFSQFMARQLLKVYEDKNISDASLQNALRKIAGVEEAADEAIAENNKKCHNDLFLIGPIICAIVDFFNSIVDGIGTFFSWVFYIIFIVGLSYCFITCCAPWLSTKFSNWNQKRKERNAAAAEKEKKQTARAKDTPTTPTPTPTPTQGRFRSGAAVDPVEVASLLRRPDQRAGRYVIDE